MRILIVSGFLGAGKTTFIRHLVNRVDRRFAILENEFGDVGIDGPLLNADAPARLERVIELNEGCVCCSMSGNLAPSVLTIANTIDPDVLIIEPSGIARLSNVLRHLNTVTYDRISVLPPVTIVDWHQFDATDETMLDQLRSSGHILLSKLDGMPDGEMAEAVAAIQSLVTDAGIESTEDALGSLSTLEHIVDGDGSAADPNNQIGGAGASESDIGSVTVISPRLPSDAHTILFLEGLTSGCFGRVARAKGFIESGNALLHIEVVGERYSIQEATESSAAVFVVIGRDLDEENVRFALRSPHAESGAEDPPLSV